MNNKGFTMVELLVAMAIMGLLMIMAFPTIRAVQTNNQKTKYEEYGKSVLSAAKLYVDSYGDDLFHQNKTNEYALLKVNKLVEKDLIKDINISGSSCTDGESEVRIFKYNDDYSYCLHLVCKSGGKEVFTSKDERSSCKKFDDMVTSVTYKYIGSEEKTYVDNVINGDDGYIVLNVSKINGFDEIMKSDHQAFENKYSSSAGGTVTTGQKITINGPITLTAVTHTYGYTITYSSCIDGVTGTTPTNSNCTWGGSCILPSNPYSKDYYSFKAWKYGDQTYSPNTDLKGKLDINSDGLTYKICAQFNKNVLEIGYNTNGGTLNSSHGSRISVSGDAIKLDGKLVHHTLKFDQSLNGDGLSNWNNPSWINLSKTGNSIKTGEEWNTKANGTGTTFNQTTAYSAKELCPDLKTGNCELVMYPKWIGTNITNKTIKVTFNCNGGTGGGSSTYTAGKTGQKFDKTCTKEGYHQTGWRFSSDTSKRYNIANGISDNWINTYSPSITLYATYDPNVCTVTYNANGGRFNNHATDLTQSVNYGSYFGDATSGMRDAKGGHYNATKTGYYINSNEAWISGSNTYDEGRRYSALAMCGNDLKTKNVSKTLKVNWKPNCVKIKLHKNDGSGTTAGPYTYCIGYSTNQLGYNSNGTYKYKCPFGQNQFGCWLHKTAGNAILGWSTNKNASSAVYSGSGLNNAYWSVSNSFINSHNGETINFYAIYHKTRAHIYYSTNGGNIKSKVKVPSGFKSGDGTVYDTAGKTVYWKTNDNVTIEGSSFNDVIYRSISDKSHFAAYTSNILYGTKLDENGDGLNDYNNGYSMYITRSGKSVDKNKEWKCLSSNCSGKIYDQDRTNYVSTDFCSSAYKDCYVVVGVNWK